MTKKTCVICNVEKSLDEFDHINPTQFRNICKDCIDKRDSELKKDTYVEPPKPPPEVVPPARMNVWDRPIYVPNFWGR